MHIDSVSITGFGPLRRRFDAKFRQHNCLIGMNGGGKTTVLSVIAGLSGTDEATGLIAGLEVGHARIKLVHQGHDFVFECEGIFDSEKITRFKAGLPHRVSFPLTEWNRGFISERIPTTVARRDFLIFGERHGGGTKGMFHYSVEDSAVKMWSGDGYRHAVWMFLNDTPDDVPVLLDDPGRHLDFVAKRLMCEMLVDRQRQLVFATHHAEMLAPFDDSSIKGKWGITQESSALIEVPNSARPARKKDA